MPIGELFILGFFGKTVPAWLKEFAARYGLGGAILFDYSCRTQQYDNNIESPEQVRRLCAEIAALPSGPMVFIDQEGGLVRRLKESRGFAPLPSAKEFNHLAPDRKRAILTASFAEMRQLGIHYDFAPVVDVDYNPENPNIGRIKRSFSADIAEVEANALLASEVARAERIGLCLKHFPGIRGGHWPFAQAPSGHAADHRRHADAGIAEGARHHGGQPAIAESRHGHALHRQQPVRSGAGNGCDRRMRRTEPARQDLVRSGNGEIGRAGGQAKGTLDGLTGGTRDRPGSNPPN